MKFPVDLPPARKAVGVALVAIVAVVIFEGTGVGAPARQFVGMATAQVKNFFSRLFSSGTHSA
jgi:hypothetical protein